MSTARVVIGEYQAPVPPEKILKTIEPFAALDRLFNTRNHATVSLDAVRFVGES
jgi:hypothetical protein